MVSRPWAQSCRLRLTYRKFFPRNNFITLSQRPVASQWTRRQNSYCIRFFFFLPPLHPLLSNTCICILRSSSRAALLASYVFSSTITRRAVTLPAAGMSERLRADFTRWRDMKRFGAESLGSGAALFAAFVARLQSSHGCDWSGEGVAHTAAWNTAVRLNGGLSFWLWLNQARRSTMGVQRRLGCHTRFILSGFNSN